MLVLVTEYLTITPNSEQECGVDFTEYVDGPYAVEVSDDWTPREVERALERRYGHLAESVGIAGGVVVEMWSDRTWSVEHGYTR